MNALILTLLVVAGYVLALTASHLAGPQIDKLAAGVGRKGTV